MMSRSSHGRWDRVFGGILLISPWLFGLAHIHSARNLFVALGLAMLVYSGIRAIPLGMHGLFDVFVGFFLMTGPYFYQYRADIGNGQALLHFAIGFGIWAVVLFTRGGPEEKKLPTTIEEIRRETFKKVG